jgi:hypothetical protein
MLTKSPLNQNRPLANSKGATEEEKQILVELLCTWTAAAVANRGLLLIPQCTNRAKSLKAVERLTRKVLRPAEAVDHPQPAGGGQANDNQNNVRSFCFVAGRVTRSYFATEEGRIRRTAYNRYASPGPNALPCHVRVDGPGGSPSD